jgi:hypothetical protein
MRTITIIGDGVGMSGANVNSVFTNGEENIGVNIGGGNTTDTTLLTTTKR